MNVRQIIRPLLWGVLALVTLAGCAWQKELSDAGALRNAFEAEFDFPPPTQVRDLRCKMVGVGDTFAKWMSFSYDAPTLERIVHKGYSRAIATEAAHSPELWRQGLTTKNPNAPRWWKIPDQLGGLTAYYRQTHPADVAGYTFIWVDVATSTIYFKSSAWH